MSPAARRCCTAAPFRSKVSHPRVCKGHSSSSGFCDGSINCDTLCGQPRIVPNRRGDPFTVKTAEHGRPLAKQMVGLAPGAGQCTLHTMKVQPVIDGVLQQRHDMARHMHTALKKQWQSGILSSPVLVLCKLSVSAGLVCTRMECSKFEQLNRKVRLRCPLLKLKGKMRARRAVPFRCNKRIQQPFGRLCVPVNPALNEIKQAAPRLDWQRTA